tara:strand:- start:482 stop:727 length:246 start_codon:yes stop_codon:yes gene_type:complete
MRIILGQRHLFNKSKPMCQLGDEWVQWDSCDLSESPPYREKGTMNAHGKFPKYNYDELPTVFTSSDGKKYPIDEIIAYKEL